MAGMGTVAQRAAFALMDVGDRVTVIQNFILMAVICIVAGMTIHAGFYRSAGAMALGLLAGIVFGYEGQIFGAAAVGALGLSALSWRTWKGEFSMRPPRPDEPS
jgi:hypothetical protein